MIREGELRGCIAKKGASRKEVAETLGVTEKTFYNKLKRGVFTNDEIAKLSQFLEIENPAYIFLPELVRDVQQRRDA